MRYILDGTNKAKLVKENAMAAVRRIPITSLIEISILPYSPEKSDAQRRKFHALRDELARAIGMDPGNMKEIIKAQIFGWTTFEWEGVTITRAAGSSEDLNRREYSELIEIVYRLAAEAEVDLGGDQG